MGGTESPWRDGAAWGLLLWGGVVAALAFPPAAVWPLVLLGPAALWVACLRARPGRAFLRGWLYGVGFFGALLWWIAPTIIRYGSLPVPVGVVCVCLLCAYLALYPALAGWVFARLAVRSPGIALAVAPLAWTGLEWVRGALLSGFPWGDLPQSLWRVGWALDLAPRVGVDGVRLVLAGGAAVLAWLFSRFATRLPAPAWSVAVPGLIVVAAVVGGRNPVVDPEPAGILRVGVVQGNIDQAQKWDPAYRRVTLETYGDLSRSLGPGLDLVLWPETAVPAYVQDPGPERETVAALARELDAPLAFGAPAYVRGEAGLEYRNAVFLMGRGGRLEGRYDKVHLVPFGEYVPLGRYLPFVKKLVTGAGDFTAGRGPVVLDAGPGVPRLGPLVCFEVIFPDLAAGYAAEGAQILVVVTNDGWFGRTPGPYQHLAFAAWRAAEVGLPLVRAANTGVSAVFDARGRMLRASELLARGAFAVDLPYPPPHRVPGLELRPWISPACLALAMLSLFATLGHPSNSSLRKR